MELSIRELRQKLHDNMLLLEAISQKKEENTFKGIKALEALHGKFTANITAKIEARFVQENDSMSQTLGSLDNDLCAVSSMIGSLSQTRGSTIEALNAVFSPRINILGNDAFSVQEVGNTKVIQDLQKGVESCFEKYNYLRQQKEINLTKLDERILLAMEKAIMNIKNKFNVKMEKSKATTQKLVSEIDEELNKAEKVVHEIETLRNNVAKLVSSFKEKN